MNYKKSLLSLVTIMALSGTASADGTATYLPLTVDNGANGDASWVLFGVNGFSDGVPSNVVAGPTSFSAGYTELEDTTVTDELATSGLAVGGDNLASLTALAEAGLSALSIGVDITGVTFEATEPVRTMYVKVNDTDPNVKFDYKASLEGKTMEIILNSSTTTVYSVTISQDSTWNNASVATTGAAAAAATGRTAIADVLDTDSTNNPVNAANWDKDTHADSTTATADFYRFDAISQQWKVYREANSAAANDFTDFMQGSAYWGRVDTVDATATNDGDSNPTNLVLGISGNTAQSQLPSAYIDDANATILSTGWNMLAMDDVKPYVRRAATGLVLTGVANAQVIDITDDTGVHTVSVTMATNGDEVDATLINTTLESARLLGTVPKSFNVKAFRSGADGTIILVSDKKFSVTETNGAGAITVTTLTGANPYVAGARAAVVDLNLVTATSAYGEFAVMMNVLVDDIDATANNTADSISAAAIAAQTGKIIFGDALNADHTAIAITDGAASGIAEAIIEIAAEGTLSPTVTQVDVNFDGANTGDMLIVAATTPFYVRDAVYTRVFTTDTTAADGALELTVAGTASDVVAPALNDAPSDVALLINAVVANTDVFAKENSGDTKLVAVTSDAPSTFDLKDIASGTIDFLANSTETEDIAKGAIKGVYSLDELAKKALIQASFPITFAVATDEPDETGDQLSVNINGLGAVNMTAATNAGGGVGTMTTAEKLAWFDGMVTSINTEIQANSLHGFASHDYTEAIDDLAGTTLTITGVDIASVALLEVSDVSTLTSVPTVGADTNAGLSTTLGSISGDLVADLKFNAVYTPNYANYGPLYTMRDSGYDVRAMLKATTDMSDSSIAWDGIDLTRDENDWFIQNEFNLFSVNIDSGYWIYLETKTADAVVIGAATYTPSYTYYFDNDTDKTTSNIINGGTLRVNITGLSDTTAALAGTTSNVYAIIAGEEIQMKANGDDYTADITKYSSVDFKETASNISFSIRATNGKGEAAKVTDAVSFDYAKPDAPTVTYDAANATFTSASADVSKFHLFDTVVPEVSSVRDAAIVTEVNATAGVGSYNVCSKFDFGTVNTLRIVAADGDGAFGTANISDATEFKYTSLFKDASVITHINGVGDKSTLPTVYDATCTLEATQPAGTENNGVSVKALVSSKSVRIAYVTEDNVNFTTNLAWGATYELPDGTDIIYVQNVEAYANDTLLVEYEGKLYTTQFPASEAAADATAVTPIALSEITPANISLAP